jgi:hypothetical protein
MKKIFYILALSIITSYVHSQQITIKAEIETENKKEENGEVKRETSESNSPDNDTTRIKLKKMEILIVSKEDHADTSFSLGNKKDDEDKKDKDDKDEKNSHWAGLDIGVNGYLTPSNSVTLPSQDGFMDLNYARSIHFAFNFFEKGIPLYKDYAKVVTGLGVDFNSYSFKNNISLMTNRDSTWGVTDTTLKFQKNKLKTTYLNLPLLLAFNTSSNPDKAFHFAAGVIFGYRIGSKTKQTYTVGKEDYTPKVKGDYNLSPFRYSATVRMGYGSYNLFASYSLVSLFEKNKGPELYPFNAGISLLF